jgi:hypothetical protein
MALNDPFMAGVVRCLCHLPQVLEQLLSSATRTVWPVSHGVVCWQVDADQIPVLTAAFAVHLVVLPAVHGACPQ